MIGELVLQARSDRDASQARLARPAHRRAARRAHWRHPPDGRIALQYASRARLASLVRPYCKKSKRGELRAALTRTGRRKVCVSSYAPVLADISKGAL
jgi:hypothetical protein